VRASHLLDATAAARRRQPLIPATWLLLALLAAIRCADPVGDPSDRFEFSPAPVIGRWIELEPTDDPPREAVVEAGAGILAGRFEFERTGLGFEVSFNQGAWDGERIRFVTGDVFGAGLESISWTALLVPAEADEPTILRFFPTINASVPFSVEYVRP
jgi:hypothetical protein